ncbi:MAG TPA: alkaline phosphatase D family protein [Opitutaceae bacterium]|nr:alkaline phosphatase D family protein [Opitutaceae bacterium]
MPTHGRNLTRRGFLSNSAALAASAAIASKLSPVAEAAAAAAATGPGGFTSDWARCPDRIWLGPEFWSNPLQDWKIAGGRIECTNAAGDRNVHLLVRSLGEQPGNFELRVRIGRADGATLGPGKGSAGFRFGIRGTLPDFRNNLIYGKGIDAGFTADGGLFIGALSEAKSGTVKLDAAEAELRLTGTASGENCLLKLSLVDARGTELGAIEKSLPRAQCTGTLALVNNFGAAAPGGGAGANAAKAGKGAAKKGNGAASPAGLGRFWFADWRVGGTAVQVHADRTFGPLLFSQYTLSGGIMKLSVQLPPIGAADSQAVRLQVRSGNDWKTIGEAPVHAEARCAAFRIEKWDATKDVAYRLAYTLKFREGPSQDHFWTGTVRRDPVNEPVLSVADISCNIHEAFPNTPFVEKLAKVNPDFLAFTGDQFYESSGGYGIIRTPTDLAMVDYLRKWYMHGWTWRELTRDRPSLSLPDDHDVYQGNIWGEGGAAQKTTQEAGGYIMHESWVNVVYRTQTAHHPDPFDPSPALRGTIQYYGPLTYGRVSFAILADRQYKSGPEGKVPPTGDRGDHETNPNFDPKTADVPGLVLLGEKQEAFLRQWVRDWRGAEMKAVISQTLFTALPTTHGGQREILRADYDTNAWPQTARNRAVREMRKAFAFHVAGDQHIPSVVRYGIDEHGDGPIGFAGPAINVGYTRWFEPERAPWLKPKQAGMTGDFTDHFGHPMTVLAVKNTALQPRRENLLQYVDDKASGMGMVRFDKSRRKIIVECWPYLADFTKKEAQMPGWPLEFDVTDNYAKKPFGHLPQLRINGTKQPLIEVSDAGGELVYALRINSGTFRPQVFAAGKYTVRVSDPDTGKSKEIRDLEPGGQRTVNVTV